MHTVTCTYSLADKRSDVLSYVEYKFIIMYKYLIFSLFILIKQSSALYFHIGETERKCFIEEIPDETKVIGKYKYSVGMCRHLMKTMKLFDYSELQSRVVRS